MHSVLTTLAHFVALGYVLIVVGVIAIAVSIAVAFVQRSRTQASGYDDPEHDDPDVYGVRRIRILFLVIGFVAAILGAAIAASPNWSTIF